MKKRKKEEALIELISENRENFYRLSYSYVKNSEDALDIVQDSIQKALLKIGELRDGQKLKSWFYRIVVNTSLDFLRRRKKIIVVEDTKLESYAHGKSDRYQDIDLGNSIDLLPPIYRTVIVLRYFEDLKIDEIAEILEENQNTIKTRIHRALSMLRIQMEETEEN
ncbi:RNA polymerase sigma-70 factor (ECF subfamily) [Bacillus sp. SORGH_AS 510]|uniref:RNA polymerase sigma factor n=1 Tax=Bacillus sp. SORGH_AS_0510 TaxID=3041771 RepID=UPI002788DE06|nr:RNA polymerase sigma factor [Bacillus sp. SORGH_AS_0510]MDQ1143845.1 RNA polymerase sigma-70 factor (ECF subfamily) [Bacillus sp. SORGH_AS_0510]